MDNSNRNRPVVKWGNQPINNDSNVNRAYAGNQPLVYDGNRPAVKQGADGEQIHGYMDRDNIFHPYDESNEHYNEQNKTTFDRNRFGNARNVVQNVNDLRTIVAQLKSAIANRNYQLTHNIIDALEKKINEL